MLNRLDPAPDPLNSLDELRSEGWRWLSTAKPWFAAVLALTGLTYSSTPASAQTATSVQVSTTGITRTVPFRGRGQLPYWISYDDCLQDDEISFPVSVNSSAARLEVWVGTSDCVERRSSRDREQCWLVAAEVPQIDPGYRIDVKVRNVVARLTDNGDVVPENLTEEVCRSSTAVNGEPLTYYFMLVNSGTPQASTTWGGGGTGTDTGFDVVGPTPPDSISVGLGESDLSVEINAPGENSDRARFRAYCVSQEDIEDEPVADAGTTALAVSTQNASLVDAGILDAGAVTAEALAASIDASVPSICNQSLLVAGSLPPSGTRYQCGEAGKAARSLRTSTLVNERLYAVALAGEDLLGNVGTLSNVECAAPVPLEDFFESYRRQGGEGGGGFCSFSPPAPLNKNREVIWGLALSLLAAFRLRRRSDLS